MYGGMETSRIIRAFQRWVPGCFVRDYTGNRGFLVIARGQTTMFDSSKNTDQFTRGLPAETLANLSPGYTPEKSIYSGMTLIRPGWRYEMRRAGMYLTDYQKRKIQKDLGHPVFGL